MLTKIEETVLQKLIENKKDDDATFLRGGDIDCKISQEVRGALEKIHDMGYITNPMYATGCHLEHAFLTEDGLNYFNKKEESSNQINIPSNVQININTVNVECHIKDSVVNIKNIIKEKYDNDPSLLQMIDELQKELDLMCQTQTLPNNKKLMERISDAIKKHEELIQPFAQLLANSLASALGIPL